MVTPELASEMGRTADVATSGFLYGESIASRQAMLDPKSQ
jgi:hypothetical protein